MFCGRAALVFFSFGRLTIQVSHSGNRILWVKTITDISCHILNPPAVWVASCNIRSMLFVHHSAGLKKKKKSFTLSIPSKIIQLRVLQKLLTANSGMKMSSFHLKWTSLGFQKVKLHQISCMCTPFWCFYV